MSYPQKQVDVLSLILLVMPDKLSHPFLEVHNSSPASWISWLFGKWPHQSIHCVLSCNL